MKKNLSKCFVLDRSASVAPIFGLMIMVLLITIGVAIDGSRAYYASSQVARALDAAALAAARALRNDADSTDAELQTVAAKFFDANLENGGASDIVYDQLALSSDRSEGSVTLNVDTRLPSTFGKLMAVDEINLPKSATAIDVSQDIELSMMLDLSGSMSGTKMSDLKLAAKDLAEIVLGSNANGASNRIAIAPYSTAVNAGSYSAAATGSSKGNTCVTERKGANAFKDKAPNNGMFNKKASSCPGSEIVPLTDSESTITNSITAMKANGWTAGHLGIAWAWYLISPNWASYWPAASTPSPYGDTSVKKAVVIMTDGEFNTAYETANGNSKSQSEKLCDGMKAVGISIYTVAFQAPASALPILQYCASSSDHYFDAQNGDGLRKAFQKIGQSLSELRISD